MKNPNLLVMIHGVEKITDGGGANSFLLIYFQAAVNTFILPVNI